MIKQVAEKQQEMANGINAIQNLLAEHVRARDIAIERNRSESSHHLAPPLFEALSLTSNDFVYRRTRSRPANEHVPRNRKSNTTFHISDAA